MDETIQNFEQQRVSSEVYEQYQQCCIDLHDLSMRDCLPKGSILHHRLYVNIQEDHPTDADWAKVISDNQGRPRHRMWDAEWEEWEVFPNRLYCSHYIGTGDKSVVMNNFRAMARKGQSILSEYLAIESSKPSKLPPFLHWLIPKFLRSTIDDLPGYYYFIYLICKLGPSSYIALGASCRTKRSESDICIDRNRFDVKSFYAINEHALAAMGHWLPSAWQLDLVAPRSETVPRWDAEMRNLWFGNDLIKRYRQRPGPQETVLEAFQKAGWPEAIADPLLHDSMKKALDPRRRLRDTILALNKNHKKTSVIYFGTNGHSDLVYWNIGRRPTP